MFKEVEEFASLLEKGEQQKSISKMLSSGNGRKATPEPHSC